MSDDCCSSKQKTCCGTPATSVATTARGHEVDAHGDDALMISGHGHSQARSPPCREERPQTRNHAHDANKDTSSLCLAVVRENGADVVVFDASGKPRTFKYKGDGRKLCFNTHGNEMADDLLTPCFDEEGNHGVPEEDCFCGVDTPHLHAHLYDPSTCHEKEDGEDSTKKNGDRIDYLASQTLHPHDDDKLAGSVMNIGVSDSMPKECNSQEVTLRQRRKSNNKWRRMHQVQHDDHVDYLVHNSETGKLHLEHPCDDCGDNDVHGSFNPVGSRRLRRSDRDDIQVHFFEVASNPFSVLEYIHSAFEPKSDRVAAATPKAPKRTVARTETKTTGKSSIEPSSKKQTIVSSTLLCNRICCAAECPVITKILTPVPGVEKIMINVPLKQVIVKHNPFTVSATDLQDALNKENMGAAVKRDGAIAEGITTTTSPGTVGRSQFHVARICCASEIPAINSLVEPLVGVKTVTINTTTKAVYVDHEIGVLSAQDICDAINQDGFGAEIRFDAATSATSARSTFVQSSLTLETDTDPDTEVLTEFLRQFDSSQMESFFADVPSKKITVSHNPFCLTAPKIVELLESQTGLVASVAVDGADPKHWRFPKLMDQVDEHNLDEDEGHTYPKPTVVLSGIFWIVSMLHFVGGNW